jgi:3-polyprenyl-4-hydroxybenzoate decarboxylase
MKYQNLRDWLSIIEHRGELTLVENVDWKLEMGAIVDVLYREHPPYAPALIFDRIKDHKPGYRALFGHFASPQRIALTLGIEEKFDHVLQFTRMYHERMKHCVPLHRIEVDSGAVQEVGARQARSVLSRLEHGWSKQLSLKQLT